MGTSTLPAPPRRHHLGVNQTDSASGASTPLVATDRSDSMTGGSLSEAVSAYEKDLIQDALTRTRGNRVQAAKLLGSTERIISYKVKKYNIDCRRFR